MIFRIRYKNIAENFNRLSIGCTNVIQTPEVRYTDRRQTDARRHIAKFAKSRWAESLSFRSKQNKQSELPLSSNFCAHISKTAQQNRSAKVKVTHCCENLIFSERELMFMFAICRRPSVCRLSSVTFVHATQAI